MGERGRRLGPWWLVVATLVVAVAIGAGIGFLLTQEDDDGDQTVAADQPAAEATVEPEPVGTPDAAAEPEGEPTSEPAAESTADATEEPTPEPTLSASAVFSDELVAEAMAEAEASPLDEPLQITRDEIATAVLNKELSDAGFDLAGLELIAYANGRSELTGDEKALLVVRSDDSAALLSGDTDSELFLTHLIESPAIAQFGVEQLVLQHSGVDDEGAFVMTITVLISDLQDAVDGTVDIFDRAAVQLERG